MVRDNEPVEQEVQGHYVDALTKGRVVVIDVPEDALNAVFGGLLSYRANHMGLTGAVINGNCRDLMECRQWKFPVFAKGTSVYGPSTLLATLKILSYFLFHDLII
jgi:regulator of RNase E activity RraA